MAAQRARSRPRCSRLPRPSWPRRPPWEQVTRASWLMAFCMSFCSRAWAFQFQSIIKTEGGRSYIPVEGFSQLGILRHRDAGLCCRVAELLDCWHRVRCAEQDDARADLLDAKSGSPAGPRGSAPGRQRDQDSCHERCAAIWQRHEDSGGSRQRSCCAGAGPRPGKPAGLPAGGHTEGLQQVQQASELCLAFSDGLYLLLIYPRFKTQKLLKACGEAAVRVQDWAHSRHSAGDQRGRGRARARAARRGVSGKPHAAADGAAEGRGPPL